MEPHPGKCSCGIDHLRIMHPLCMHYVSPQPLISSASFVNSGLSTFSHGVGRNVCRSTSHWKLGLQHKAPWQPSSCTPQPRKPVSPAFGLTATSMSSLLLAPAWSPAREPSKPYFGSTALCTYTHAQKKKGGRRHTPVTTSNMSSCLRRALSHMLRLNTLQFQNKLDSPAAQSLTNSPGPSAFRSTSLSRACRTHSH